MLDKVKKINELRKAQSRIQKQLEEISYSASSGEYSLKIRGDKKIEELLLNGKDMTDLRDLLNSSMREVDKKVQKKMKSQLSDLGIDL